MNDTKNQNQNDIGHAIHTFFDQHSKEKVNERLTDMFRSWLGSDDADTNPPIERSNYFTTYTHLIDLVEKLHAFNQGAAS
ncbi:MAG: hypothetical protein HXX16_17245 [Bacteroidales bacterium]|nr:hypothetical protein [Bacteroidales bacterium]